MKKVIAFLLLFVIQNAFSQKGAIIVTDSFTGIIFPKETSLGEPNRIKRFSPTKRQVLRLEKELKKLNETKVTVTDSNRLPPKAICADLTKCYRQYFGLFNGPKRKWILVKLFPKDSMDQKEMEAWRNEILLMKYPEMEYPSMRFNLRNGKFDENYVCGK